MKKARINLVTADDIERVETLEVYTPLEHILDTQIKSRFQIAALGNKASCRLCLGTF